MSLKPLHKSLNF